MAIIALFTLVCEGRLGGSLWLIYMVGLFCIYAVYMFVVFIILEMVFIAIIF